MVVATGMKPRPLTEKQERVYRFIFTFTLVHGYQPSYRDIMVAMGGRSPTAIRCHLKAISRRGWVACSSATEHGQAARCVRFLYTPDREPFRGFRLPDPVVAKSGVD